MGKTVKTNTPMFLYYTGYLFENRSPPWSIEKYVIVFQCLKNVGQLTNINTEWILFYCFRLKSLKQLTLTRFRALALVIFLNLINIWIIYVYHTLSRLYRGLRCQSLFRCCFSE